MATFVDALGDKWTITLLRPQFKRVQEELSIDLLQMGDMVLLQKLIDDPATIVDVISVVLTEEIRRRHEIEKPNESIEMWFARRLTGDALDAASDALIEEIVNFFPTRRRIPMQAALNKTRELMTYTTQRAMQMIQSGSLDAIVKAELEQHFKAGSGNEAGNISSVPADT